MFRRVLQESDSLDNIRETGFYFSDNNVEHGVIIVVTYSYGTIQIVAGNRGIFKMRAFWGSWFDWIILEA